MPSRGLSYLPLIYVPAALLLLLSCIRYSGFWIDELYTLHAIRLPWREMVLERLRNGHFPAYFALMKLLHETFRSIDTELILRLPSVLCWAGAVWSFVLLARRFLLSVGWITTVLLFSLNLMVLRQADEARMYTMVLLIAVWMTRCYLEMVNGGAERKWQVLLPVLTAAAYAISSSAILLTVSMLIYALRLRKTVPRLWLVVLVSLCVGAAVFIPGAILHLHTAERAGIAGIKRIQIVAHWIMMIGGVQSEDDYFAARLPLQIWQGIAALATVLVCFGWWKQRKALPGPVGACAALTIIPFILMLLAEPISEISTFRLLGPPRYLISFMPSAAVIVAYVIGQYIRRPSLALTCNLLIGTFLIIGDYFILTVRTEPLRERVQAMAKSYRPGDGVIVVPEEIADGVEMYGRGVKVDAAINRKLRDEGQITRELQPLAARPTVWLVWYRGQDSPVLLISEKLFGSYESNNKKKALGSLRILEFHPIAAQPKS